MRGRDKRPRVLSDVGVQSPAVEEGVLGYHGETRAKHVGETRAKHGAPPGTAHLASREIVYIVLRYAGVAGRIVGQLREQTATSFQRAKETILLFPESAYLMKNIALYQLFNLYMFSCESGIESHVGLGWSLEKVFIGLPKPSAERPTVGEAKQDRWRVIYEVLVCMCVGESVCGGRGWVGVVG